MTQISRTTVRTGSTGHPGGVLHNQFLFNRWEIMNKPNLEIIGSLDRSLSESLQDNQSEPTCEAGWSVLHRLSNAHKAAYACGRDAWDFSIKLSEIQNLGAETYVVRKLICQGLIVHRKETTGAIPSDDKRRTFGETDGLALSEKSCFVVSKQGYQILNSYKMNLSLIHI